MKRTSVASGAASLMVVFAASRILGLLRDRAIGGAFGSGAETGAFVSAYLIPDMLFLLLAGGALSAAFVPLFTAHLARGEHEQASSLANSVLNLLMLVTAAVGLAAVAAAPMLITIVAPGYASSADADVGLSVHLARIMTPMVFFTAVAALFAGILNSHEHFLAPAVGWCFFNIVIIAMTVLLGDRLGIIAPTIGVLIGAVMLCVTQMPSLAARGFRYRPVLQLNNPEVGAFVKMVAVSTVGLTIGQLNILFVPCILASFFGGDAVTNVRFATRLMALPLGVFAVSIATAAFPTLAKNHAGKSIEEFRDNLVSALNALVIISIPVGAAMIILGEPVVRLLYGTGKFDEIAIRGTAFALSFYAIGIPAFAAVQLLERAYFARRDMLTPTIFAAVAVGITLVGGLALSRTGLKYAGPGLACSISGIVNLGLAFLVLRGRMKGLRGSRVMSCGIKSLAAAVPMALVMYWCASALSGPLCVEPPRPAGLSLPTQAAAAGSGTAGVAIQLLAAGTAGAVVYAAGILGLGVKEARTAAKRLSVFFRRSSG